jgi:DUF4097 and DUF4098 domain-containing protein YvlB
MTRTRTARLLRLVAVAAVVVPLAGCELATASFRAEAKEEWNRTFTLPADGTFEVENTNGAIEVEPATGSEVEVRAERIAKSHSDEAARDLLKQIEIAVEQSGNRVRLKSKFPRSLHMSSAEVRYSVKVPASLSVRLENTNGRVSVNGVAGAVEASTTNGGVSGRALKGPVKASTTNGGVDVDVDAVHAGGIELETTNGGVKLHLPSSAKADLSASCVNGGISIDRLSMESGRESSRRHVEGQVNGGGPKVRVETVNGGVHVVGK